MGSSRRVRQAMRTVVRAMGEEVARGGEPGLAGADDDGVEDVIEDGVLAVLVAVASVVVGHTGPMPGRRPLCPTPRLTLCARDRS